jgi:hypothetical protein
MPSITSWIRLEPDARDPEMTPGIEARIHDPLWLLTRQWQLAELDGEDGGTAMLARTRYVASPIDAFTGPRGAAVAVDAAGPPLAALVEAGRADRAVPVPDLAGRARDGRKLVAMLRAAGLARAAAAAPAVFGFALAADELAALDAADRELLDVVAGRAPDATRAATAIGATPPGLPAQLVTERRDAVAEVCAAWLAWYRRREVTTPGPGWRAELLAAPVAVAASLGGRRWQLAGEHDGGGEVGWTTFAATDRGAVTDADTPRASTSIPAPVRYRGMPSRRYWDLEDGATSWAALDASPDDVARMLFVEFAIAFSDDWAIVPIAAPPASLVEVRSLVVTDTFGVQTEIKAAATLDGPARPWRMYTLAGTERPLLLALPGVAAIDGEVRDRVDLARSEVSNLAWAIERRATRADGSARDVAPVSPAATVEGAAAPRYVLGSPVPAGWHPLRPAAGPAQVLVRAAIPGQAQPPLTATVAALDRVADAELAGGDVRVETRSRLARGADGRYHVWTATRAAPIAAVPTVALVFDAAVRGEEPK